MAWQAFHLAAFSAADPEHRTSRNAGLNGAVPGVTSRWILEEIVFHLDSQHVVWGLSSLDIAPEYGETECRGLRHLVHDRSAVVGGC
jgi:hypothetical protein